MHELKPKRTIPIIGSINDESMEKTVKTIFDMVHEDSAEWIHLLIASGGGNVTPGLAVFDLLTSPLKLNIQTLCMGDTGSMGVIVFLAGAHRVITSHSRIYLHEMTRTFKDAIMNIAELRGEVLGMEHFRSQYVQIVASRTGKLSAETVSEFMRNERIITPSEAVEMGFAHEIV